MVSPGRPHHDEFIEWLATKQVERPWLVLAFVLLITVPAFVAMRRLTLKTDFAELLPDNKPSVVEMRRVADRLSSASTLTIVAEGQDTQALKRFVDESAPRLRMLGEEWVGSVDAGVHEAQAFLEKNRLLYAPFDDLKELRDKVVEQYDYEVGKRTGLGLDLAEPEEPLTAESVERRIRRAEEQASSSKSQYPDGYYLGEDGHFIVMMVRTPVSGGNEELAAQLLHKVHAALADATPVGLDQTIRVGYTGDFITGAEEIQTVKQDLLHVGAWGVGMVLGVVLLFFLRLRTLLAMSITIGVGLVWSFGLARYTVGHLNSSTGFLVSIIAGNGINFGIIYMARYLEARRAQHMDMLLAMRQSHRDTWLATLAAASAAMVAYGSLAATDFRGFKHFGLIGGLGMLVCWVATYLTLPPVLAISERVAPMFVNPSSLRSRVRGVYGLAFAWLADRCPRVIVVLALASGAVASWMTARYALSHPMEYDLSNVSNDHQGKTPARKLSVRVDKIVGRIGQDGMAVMVDHPAQASVLKTVLMARREAAPAHQKPFERVVTIFDLLPDRQTEKIAMIGEVVDRLRRAHEKRILLDGDWSKIEPHIPKEPLVPLGPADLPERMARPFIEKDGTRGRIVYIAPTEGRSIWDGHYLDLWANSYRSVELPSGDVIQGSGRAVVYSDMLAAVREDAPVAIVISLVGTIAVALAAFRMRRESWLVLLSLGLGLAWLVSFMYWRGIKLNFLNFVALPITIGVGADYTLNIMRRFRVERYRRIHEIVAETGGAVVLCSLTTVLGYTALLFSMNRAIRSFGLVAAVGELTTLVAAVLVLPSLLTWHARRIGMNAD